MARVVCERCGAHANVSVLNPNPECEECGGGDFTPPREE
jgi:hypothetical protein